MVEPISSNEDYSITLYKENNKVGSIEVNPKADYSTSLSSLTINWLGMHAYVDGEVNEFDTDNYKLTKAHIGYELSPAEAMQGKAPEPVQLHYFYAKNYFFIDFYVNTDYISENCVDRIAKSLVLKYTE